MTVDQLGLVVSRVAEVGIYSGRFREEEEEKCGEEVVRWLAADSWLDAFLAEKAQGDREEAYLHVKHCHYNHEDEDND